MVPTTPTPVEAIRGKRVGTDMASEEPWIGFVHVQPRAGLEPLGEGLKGAYAHILALASSFESYEEVVRQSLYEEGLVLIELKDVSPISVYREEGRIPSDMDELIGSLSSEFPVQFDTFDAYREHDA